MRLKELFIRLLRRRRREGREGFLMVVRLRNLPLSIALLSVPQASAALYAVFTVTMASFMVR